MPRKIEELIDQQIRRAEISHAQRGAMPERPGCVITISRRAGVGARYIAQKLADDLKFSLWDRELVEAIASDAAVSRRIVEAFDEKTISEVELLVRSAFGDKELGGFVYGPHLAHALAAISKLGNAIILGRGAHLLLPDALHVHIDASDHKRIQNRIDIEAMTHEEAIRTLHKSDVDRMHFLYNVYGKEKLENAVFDLSLWMDRLSTDDAVEIIETAAKAWMRKGACSPATPRPGRLRAGA